MQFFDIILGLLGIGVTDLIQILVDLILILIGDGLGV